MIKNSAAFVGYYDHYPNIEGMKWYLQEIHPLVTEKIASYKVFVIGRGDLTALKQAAPQDGSVEFIGEVKDIIEHIAGIKVCLAPLISGAGSRGKLNQYVVAGKPVVSTSIGSCGFKYVHKKSMWIADEPGGFAEGIVHLLSNQQAYNEINAEAQKVVKQEYLWPGSIALLEKLYLA